MSVIERLERHFLGECDLYHRRLSEAPRVLKSSVIDHCALFYWWYERRLTDLGITLDHLAKFIENDDKRLKGASVSKRLKFSYQKLKLKVSKMGRISRGQFFLWLCLRERYSTEKIRAVSKVVNEMIRSPGLENAHPLPVFLASSMLVESRI